LPKMVDKVLFEASQLSNPLNKTATLSINSIFRWITLRGLGEILSPSRVRGKARAAAGMSDMPPERLLGRAGQGQPGICNQPVDKGIGWA